MQRPVRRLRKRVPQGAASRAVLAGVLLAAGVASAGRAGPVATMDAGAVEGPRGQVLLVIADLATPQHGSRVRKLDLAMLQAFPHHRFTTTTVWTRGRQRFEGVLLRDLVAWLNVPPGAVLHAHAANDYVARIPLSDATDPGPMIAYLRNGKPMRLRDKGPLWLVYPYDAGAQWQTEVVYSRSIWQLDRITIAPGLPQ